jgi:hypothetical protein
LGEDLIACIRFGRELGKERGKEAIEVLFLGIAKITIIICHCG